jgi:hypothetical protein
MAVAQLVSVRAMIVVGRALVFFMERLKRVATILKPNGQRNAAYRPAAISRGLPVGH